MKKDFEIVPSSRETVKTQEYYEVNVPTSYEKDRLIGAFADNMPKIIELAKDIAEIRKIKVISNAIISELDKKKELLLAEAEVYVKKSSADSKAVIDKIEMVRLILREYYQYNAGNKVISDELFADIITGVLRG